MRHHDNIRRFGRTKNGRTALMKGLILSMIAHGRIETTEAKAKELRPAIEKMITLANKGTLSSHRLLVSRIYNQKAPATKIIKEIAPKYKGQNGGYTRISKLKPRLGDASKMAVIEFI
ncbi:MAG: large subunit ribosomal protein [Patescibacteria group bacterium]|nr:large subunit ribosomal protein [Patescibacteria group bacterium]